MKKLLIFLFVLFSFMLIPVKTNAKDKATIYLFRGKGCGYCRALLTFLNSINDEYGDMYELKSYEVWNDQTNSWEAVACSYACKEGTHLEDGE